MTDSLNPNVDVEILNQTDSDAPGSTVEEVGIIGTSTGGSTANIQILSRDSLVDLATIYGEGPLPRSIREAFQAGARIIKALRCATSATGTAGTPDVTDHSGNGTVAFTGSPNDDYQIVLEFLVGGARGTATFRWSKDGGDTWSDVLVTAASVTLTGTGLAATFTDGDPTSGSFVAGDNVRVATTGPSPTANDVGTAVDTFTSQAWTQDGRGPYIIAVVNTSGDTVWAGLETKRAALHTAHRYVAFLAAARGPNAGESMSTYVASLVSGKTTTSPYVSIVQGRVELRDTLGLQREVNTIGLYLGRLAATLPPRSPGITRANGFEGPIPGAVGLRPATFGGPEPVPSLTEAQIKTLADAGFVTCRVFHGLAGVYFRDGRTAASNTTQLAEIQYVRPALEAAHAVRLALLPCVNSDASPAALKGYEAEAQTALNGLAARGRIVEGRAIIDPAQPVIAQGYVAVQLLLRYSPTAKWFAVTVQYTRALPAAA